MFLQVMPQKISFPWADTPLSSCAATFLVFQLKTLWLCLSCKNGQRPFCTPYPDDMAWPDFRHWLLLLSEKHQAENTQTVHGQQARAVS